MHSIHAYCSAHSCRQRFPYFFRSRRSQCIQHRTTICLSLRRQDDRRRNTTYEAGCSWAHPSRDSCTRIKLFKWLSGRTIRAKQVDLIDPVLRIAKHITNLIRHPFIPKDASAKARSLFGKNFISAHELMFNFTAFTDKIWNSIISLIKLEIN